MASSELPEGSAPLKAAVKEWSIHWRTGVASMVGMGLCLTLLTNIFSVFVHPLEEAFGWSRGQIATAQSAALISALAAPLVGRLIDTYGVRRLILGGMSIMIVMYLILAAMPGPIWIFYLCYLGLLVGGLPTSGLGFTRVISAAFVKSRGLSLAIGRSGFALSAIVMPPLLYGIISAYSWRAGYLTMAILISCLALPTAWLWINRDTHSPNEREKTSSDVSWRSLIMNWKVLAVALASALAYTPILAILSQLQPILIEKGAEPGLAAGLVGLLGLATFTGAVITGVLIDRFWAPLIAMIVMALAAGGVILIVISNGDLRLAITGVLLLGLAHGAELDIAAFVIARYFGLKAFSTIFGLTISAMAIASAFGFPAIGYVYDNIGSYDPAMGIAAVSLLLSGVVYLLLGKYPQNP